MREAMRDARRRLTPIYGRGETEAILRLAFHYLKGWSPTDMAIHEADTLSDFTRRRLDEICTRLEKGEPIQYITSDAYFYGMHLRVEPGVLIPRPETEDLIDLVLDRTGRRADMHVLDIGTGSGAIALALARNLPFSRVGAIDISEGALRVARENARTLRADVDFQQADVFSWEPEPRSLDIIVSNPPYVDESERAQMEPNVLDYEPAEALFVPDTDPLRYYRRIAALGTEALRPGGLLFFEINPRHEAEMRRLLERDYTDVEIMRDRFGRSRLATCKLPHRCPRE